MRDRVARGRDPRIELWIEGAAPTPRLPWHDYDGGAVTDVAGCHLEVERVFSSEGGPENFWRVRVLDRRDDQYDVTAWLVSTERGVVCGGRAVERAGASGLKEAEGWAEKALAALALDSAERDPGGWGYVLAALSGWVAPPEPEAVLRARAGRRLRASAEASAVSSEPLHFAIDERGLLYESGLKLALEALGERFSPALSCLVSREYERAADAIREALRDWRPETRARLREAGLLDFAAWLLKCHVENAEARLPRGVSADWVLSQLAGGSYPAPGSAYDHVRRSLSEAAGPGERAGAEPRDADGVRSHRMLYVEHPRAALDELAAAARARPPRPEREIVLAALALGGAERFRAANFKYDEASARWSFERVCQIARFDGPLADSVAWVQRVLHVGGADALAGDPLDVAEALGVLRDER